MHMVHVMHVVMVMMVVVMMVMMLHRRCRLAGGRGHGARGRGRCVLRQRVSGEAERENRRGGKGLDHERKILWLGKPRWVARNDRDPRLNSI